MIERHIRLFYPTYNTSRITSIRTSTEPEIRDAILWEYGLDPLLPFAVEPNLIDRQINDFIRLRGTVESIRMAMRWIGFPAIRFLPLSTRDYEVDSGRIPTEREIQAIRAALSVSVQARGVLKRIFNGTFEVKYG
ncbi:MAG: hypothetical protein M3Q07_20685 [Pseudobdellovibrionaceae bacterium]|nr:hypothetical protein [Pseudobdellovibrionaceae bacterium]